MAAEVNRLLWEENTTTFEGSKVLLDEQTVLCHTDPWYGIAFQLATMNDRLAHLFGGSCLLWRMLQHHDRHRRTINVRRLLHCVATYLPPIADVRRDSQLLQELRTEQLPLVAKKQQQIEVLERQRAEDILQAAHNHRDWNVRRPADWNTQNAILRDINSNHVADVDAADRLHIERYDYPYVHYDHELFEDLLQEHGDYFERIQTMYNEEPELLAVVQPYIAAYQVSSQCIIDINARQAELMKLQNELEELMDAWKPLKVVNLQMSALLNSQLLPR